MTAAELTLEGAHDGWVMDELNNMAERWEETPAWHGAEGSGPFHGGTIKVSTRTLHAVSIFLAYLRTTAERSDAND